mmetsp:Transcript_927/g.1843  ORF Transcript_927/g.1843 Transcript_927/m.1843 type:complete len:213 (+) Transcript_927:100-738(+)
MADDEDQEEMPVKMKPRKKEPEEKPVFTWQDLEKRKAKAACAMDRVEFLASTRNRFTEFRAHEANTLAFTIRSRKNPKPLMEKKLATSSDGAAEVLAKQELALQNGNTGLKRLEAVSKFVYDKELRTGGKQAAESAKNFAKTSQPFKRPYPLYDELFSLQSHMPGEPREPPLGPGSTMRNYEPPQDALRHGMSKTMSSSMYSLGSRSAKSER